MSFLSWAFIVSIQVRLRRDIQAVNHGRSQGEPHVDAHRKRFRPEASERARPRQTVETFRPPHCGTWVWVCFKLAASHIAVPMGL